MIRLKKSIAFASICLIPSMGSFAQNLDLVEGFYEILEKESTNSRQMLLRGDSSLVYYIAEQPVVSKYDRKDAEVDTDSKSVYLFFDEHGTKKLLDFTTHHIGGKIGFVQVGSLRKIYAIEEIIDNGVIEMSAQNFHKVNRKPPKRVK